MKNVFENAKFGDIYVTGDGIKNSFCSFTYDGSDKLARLYREGWGVIISYLDGTMHSGWEFGKDFTIVGRLSKSIDEEELDELADEDFENDRFTNMPQIINYYKLGFKVGYRKAIEGNK